MKRVGTTSWDSTVTDPHTIDTTILTLMGSPVRDAPGPSITDRFETFS